MSYLAWLRANKNSANSPTHELTKLTKAPFWDEHPPFVSFVSSIPGPFAENFDALQNQVRQLAGHSWQQLAASMTPERWANIAELMASADDGARFLKDWTARNILALNIARGVVSQEQTRAVICRACGPVFTHRTRADDPTGQDGSEQGLDCVLSCEWCGRGVPNRRPELGGMPSCF